jgi:hypothetical protein
MNNNKNQWVHPRFTLQRCTVHVLIKYVIDRGKYVKANCRSMCRDSSWQEQPGNTRVTYTYLAYIPLLLFVGV